LQGHILSTAGDCSYVEYKSHVHYFSEGFDTVPFWRAMTLKPSLLPLTRLLED
jgi:hypothetical protein